MSEAQTTPTNLRSLLRSGLGVAVAMAVQNVATYGFTILAARRLGPAEYGAVASLMGLLLVVLVLSLGLQATGARKIAASPERRGEIEAELMSAAYRSALGVGVLLVALTPLITWALDLDSWTAALMVGLAAVPSTIVGGQSGVLQGESRWAALGAIYVGVGVSRLAIAGLFLWLSPTASAAMLGVAVAAWVPALIGAVSLGHVGRGLLGGPAVRTGDRLLREVLGNSHALLAFFALTNVDVLVARATFDEHVAGLYAGGLILSKAVLFLPQFVVVIAFPSMAARERQRFYLKGLVVVAGIGLVASAGAAVLSGLAVTFVGGPAYADIEPVVWLFAALGTLLAMIQLMVYEVVARQHRASVWVIWAGLVAVLVSAAVVSTERGLLVWVTAVDLLVLGVLLVTALRRSHPSDAG